jgi:alpha-beta hydrolase superfamily lysophospholipase
MHTIDLETRDGMRLEATIHPAHGPRRPGVVVTVHGLGMDMDEGGMYLRLAERLAQAGITTLRFSFRGHGGSDGTQRSLTIADQALDLTVAIDAAETGYPGGLYVVASGFGAVSVLTSLPRLERRLRGLVLWQPILDLRATFLEPRLPWGLANFGTAARRTLERDGYLVVDGEVELGRTMFEEMSHHSPVDSFVASRLPTLIIHGSADTRASHAIAVQAAATHPDCRFHSILGTDHGFDAGPHEDEVLGLTVEWLLSRHAE